MPPASSHLAEMPVPAPPPMTGSPAATLARKRLRIPALLLSTARPPCWHGAGRCSRCRNCPDGFKTRLLQLDRGEVGNCAGAGESNCGSSHVALHLRNKLQKTAEK